MKNYREIFSRFDTQANVTEIKPLGNGLINDTFIVRTEGSAPDYVMQRVNTVIFTDPDVLMNNIVAVTEHIRTKLEAAGTDDIDRKVLRFIPDKTTGKYYYTDADGDTWRLSVFIPGTVTIDYINETTAECVGRTFGNFQAMLADLDAPLEESIPKFHNIEFRLDQLREAVENDAAGRLHQVRDVADTLLSYADEMSAAEVLHREGKLPKRICHCDTKANNILFDADGSPLCVIDLDTVMPSYIFSDYGDFMRTAAATLPEDNPDIDKVALRPEIHEAFTRGYLEAATFLTPLEKEMLPYGACLFAYMQAVRFFADYLNGDTYYKTAYPDHNLVRTRNQLALFLDMRRYFGMK